MKTRIRYAFGRAAWAKLVLICIAMLWAAIPASAATLPVTNCEDAGPGSLRGVVAAAVSDDTIDLTQAGCGRIRLAGQPIVIPQDNLSIVGAGRYKMVIDGHYKSSVLRHMGTGVLRISGLSVEHGQHVVYDGDGIARGGCIYSAGDVNIEWVEVRHCGAHSRVAASGGGIHAQRGIVATQSVIHSNAATGGSPNGGGAAAGRITINHSRVVNNRAGGSGGGLYAVDNLIMHSSTLANNSASQAGGAYTGGVIEELETYIVGSTVSGNTASGRIGAIRTEFLHLINSTVSGNTASDVAAIDVGTSSLDIINSTIAYNSDDGGCSPAVVSEFAGWRPSHFESSIFAKNGTCGTSPGIDLEMYMGEPALGANNLIMRIGAATQVPQDTISADPKLEPLADNGGVRLTHAPMADSPAIDAGNNAAGLAYDQRGPGYPRTKGAGTDIGAYER